MNESWQRDHAQRVRCQYDWHAGVYDRLWQHYTEQSLSVLASVVRVQPGERMLDVGCGTGAFEARLVAAGNRARLMGVDVSPQMLARARRKVHGAPNVAFIQADAHALPFSDGHFDAVVSASAFHYFEEPVVALQGMLRVLKPGGRLCLLDWCRNALACRLCDALLQRIDPAHRASYTQDELHGLLREAGFSVRQSRRFRIGLVWGMMVVEAAPAA